MSELSQKLHYSKNGIDEIALYTTTGEVPSKYMQLTVGGINCYAGLATSSTEGELSQMNYRDSSGDYKVLKSTSYEQTTVLIRPIAARNSGDTIQYLTVQSYPEGSKFYINNSNAPTISGYDFVCAYPNNFTVTQEHNNLYVTYYYIPQTVSDRTRTDFTDWFRNNKQSGDLSLQDVVNTYSATTFYNMFYNNASLTVPPKMNFSNVTHIHGMLQRCANLGPNLDMGYYDLSNVIDMHFCFYSCSKLKTIDFSKTDTSKVENWEGVFKDCTQLEEIIGALDLSSATKVFDMLTNTHLYTNPVHFKNVPRRLFLDVGNTYYVVDNYID